VRFVRDASLPGAGEMIDTRPSHHEPRVDDPPPMVSSIGWAGWLGLFGFFALAVVLVVPLTSSTMPHGPLRARTRRGSARPSAGRRPATRLDVVADETVHVVGGHLGHRAPLQRAERG